MPTSVSIGWEPSPLLAHNGSPAAVSRHCHMIGDLTIPQKMVGVMCRLWRFQKRPAETSVTPRRAQTPQAGPCAKRTRNCQGISLSVVLTSFALNLGFRRCACTAMIGRILGFDANPWHHGPPVHARGDGVVGQQFPVDVPARLGADGRHAHGGAAHHVHKAPEARAHACAMGRQAGVTRLYGQWRSQQDEQKEELTSACATSAQGFVLTLEMQTGSADQVRASWMKHTIHVRCAVRCSSSVQPQKSDYIGEATRG